MSGIAVRSNRIFIIYVREVIEPIAAIPLIFEDRTRIYLASDQGEVKVFWQIAPDRNPIKSRPFFDDLVEGLPKFIKLPCAGVPDMITDIPAVISSFIFPICEAKRDVCKPPIGQASHKENPLGLKFLDQAQQPPS
jgi:hypothetical protein